jgi:hypothetical protein
MIGFTGAGDTFWGLLLSDFHLSNGWEMASTDIFRSFDGYDFTVVGKVSRFRYVEQEVCSTSITCIRFKCIDLVGRKGLFSPQLPSTR